MAATENKDEDILPAKEAIALIGGLISQIGRTSEVRDAATPTYHEEEGSGGRTFRRSDPASSLLDQETFERLLKKHSEQFLNERIRVFNEHYMGLDMRELPVNYSLRFERFVAVHVSRNRRALGN